MTNLQDVSEEMYYNLISMSDDKKKQDKDEKTDAKKSKGKNKDKSEKSSKRSKNNKNKNNNKKDAFLSGAGFYLGINIIFYIVVIYLISFAANKAYDFSYQIFGDVAMEEAPGTTVTISIGTGETPSQVAQNLEDKKVIKSKYAFLIRYQMDKKSMVPGEYELSTSMNYEQIIEKINENAKNNKK